MILSQLQTGNTTSHEVLSCGTQLCPYEFYLVFRDYKLHGTFLLENEDCLSPLPLEEQDKNVIRLCFISTDNKMQSQTGPIDNHKYSIGENFISIAYLSVPECVAETQTVGASVWEPLPS